MSQGQPQRSRGAAQSDQDHPDPIKYGDVLPVSGDLASETIAPQDAAMMQSAETRTLGHTQRGGPAAVMQSAAEMNERAGLVGHDEVSDIPGALGVSVAQTDLPGRHVVTEAVGGQLVGQYQSPAPVVPSPAPLMTLSPGGTPESNINRDRSTPVRDGDTITIGEALEATSLAVGDKPVSRSDAAAIQAAEARLVGAGITTPGGLGAEAQSAAAANEMVMADENKSKLSDLLSDATRKLPGDKSATREDAERVIAAELRNNQTLATHPGGVAESVAAAARLNEDGSLL